MFDYLLTRFTEPNEVFGPFDIRRLREGDLVTNTQGMLPEAQFVFLDELLNANSAILNSLLMVLNERVFRRGRETISIPALMFVGASNQLPQEESLRALVDRFLLRVHCDNVPTERLSEMLTAGWRWETDARPVTEGVSIEDLKLLQQSLSRVDLRPALPAYLNAIRRMRATGIPISDRRAVKLQRLLAASALICGREEVELSDLWVLRHIWETQEQQSLLDSLVGQILAHPETPASSQSHPRSRQTDRPNPEELARDLAKLSEEAKAPSLSSVDLSILKDKLSLLSGRCEWVLDPLQRKYLQDQITQLWAKLGAVT